MTTAARLIGRLGSAGIKLWLDDNRQLRFRAPKGALTAELKEELLANKPDIIAFLQQSTGTEQQDSIRKLPREDNAAFPLSFAQRRFWFLDRLSPGNPSLHIPAVLRIRGPLDIACLQKAVDRLCQRQELLRCIFTSDENNEPRQLILPQSRLQLQEDYDLSHLSEAERQEQLAEIIHSEALRPFALNSDLQHPVQLLRMRIVRINHDNAGNAEHRLLITLHHMIADGWSIPLLIHEMGELYRAEKQQQRPDLGELSIQYVDYASWQQNRIDSGLYQQQLQYWQQQLAGLGVLNLPTDFARPRHLGHHGANCRKPLDKHCVAGVHELAGLLNTSVFVVLLSVFKILMYRYSSQQDICIGTPAAGRDRQALEPIIGCFINLLAIRSTVDSGHSFSDFARQVNNTLLDAHENKDVPFELVAEKCTDQRSLAHTPAFQVLFTFQQNMLQTMHIDHLSIDLLPQPSQTAKYDLQLHIDESGNRFTADIEYNCELFRSDTINNILRHFNNLLKHVIADPGALLRDLDIFDASDRAVLTPHTRLTPPAGSLLLQLEKTARQYAQQTAVIEGDRRISYSELHKQADILANCLLDAGVQPGDRVGLCLHPGIAQIVGLLSAIKCGACYVPMDTQYPDERLRHMADNAAMKIIVTHDDQLQRLADSAPLLAIETVDFSATSSPVHIEVNNDNLLYLIYTSGSTGLPKGAGVSIANELNLLNWYTRSYQINTDDRFLVFSAFGFDLTQKNLLAPLVSGAGIVFSGDRFYDPQHLLDTIASQRITHTNCAPSAFYPIVELAQRHQRLDMLGGLRHVLFGGEPVMVDNLAAWTDSHYCHARISNMYGPTECTDITCSEMIDDLSQYQGRAIPIGETIDGVYAYVLDGDMNPVPLGAPGELYIGGNSVGKGYFHQKAMTEQSFVKNPFGDGRLYRTRDLVRYCPDSLPDMKLTFLSRIDDQVKIRGFRVELGEVNTRLMQCEGVKESLVIHDNGESRQQLLAYYIAENGHTLQPQTLRDALKKCLPDYMIPAAFVAIDQWPLSANGKIDKKRLPAPGSNDLVHSVYTPPSTLLQQQIVEIWQQALAHDQIGIEDNFFELGGHSLTATRLIAAVSERFSIDIPLPYFFQHPTVAAMEHFIEQGADINDMAQQVPIEPVDRNRPVALSHAQERLWIIDQLSPGNSAYNMPLAFCIDGPLDIDAFNRALQTIVQRHESLRTRIAMSEEGVPCQQIMPPEAIALEQLDYSDSPQAMDKARALFNTTAATAFDLMNEPLCRLQLVRLDKQRHVFIACLHHIIADGWSLTVLQQELSQLYQAFHQTLDNPLPYPAIQYADFAMWQRQYLQQDHQQQQLQYWLDTLRDIPPHLNLPTDKARPQQQSFNGGMYSCYLPQATARVLTEFARQHGITLFNLLISLYALLLEKYSNQQDICIGTPVSGRDDSRLHRLIGYFVNAVVIRADLAGNPDMLTLVRRLQNTCLGAFAHQDIPVEKVLEHLPLERNTSYPPVAQVAFSHISSDLAAPLTLDGLEVATVEHESVVAKYDLTLITMEKPDGLQLNFEYNSDLFEHKSIATMAGHFCQLIEQGLATPSEGVDALSLLNADELARAVDLHDRQLEAVHGLTAMQSDMVLGQWLAPDSLANTLGYRAEVGFYVDDQLWRQAIQAVCDQQPVTRTLFRHNRLKYGDFAYQAVLGSLPVQLEVMDYRTETLNEQMIDQRVHDFIYQPQAYRDDIFIRYGLMRISDNRTLLLLSSHHALLDGVSIVLIAQETAHHYQALHDGRTPQPTLQPADIAADTRRDLQAMDRSDTLAFWREKLAQCEALDFPASACEQQRRQIVKTLDLSADMTAQLKRYCRKKRITPAHLIKLLYGLLIGHYCRADNDFYISEFNAGRNRDNATALGCYFTQTPFIFTASLFRPDKRIDDWFNWLKDYRKSTRAHDAISMGKTRSLAPQGRLHFMYNYYHFFPQDQVMQGHAITCIETPPFIDQTVQFVAKEKENNITLDLYYQSDVFNDMGFLERLVQLCEQLLSGSERIADLMLVSQQEQQQQLQQWNPPVSDLPDHICVQSLFEKQAAATPDAIAIYDDDGDICYRELNEQANRLAHHLHRQGIGSDICVGVCLPRSIDAMIAILAIIKAGGAYVPIDAAYPRQRIQHILQQAHIHTLITADEHLELFDDFEGMLLTRESISDKTAACPADNLRVTHDNDDLLYVIFTSGSTGLPKGAAVTHRGEVNLLNWYKNCFAFNSDSRCLIISALGFDLTQKNLFAPLVSGGTLVLSRLQHFDIDKILQLIEQHRISHINCAPSAFYPLLENQDSFARLQSLRHVIFGGEAIQVDKVSAWMQSAECQARLSNNYGPTECTDIALYYTVDDIRDFARQAIPAGRPNDNVNVYIVNPLLQLLPAGLTGEIVIAGNGVGRGYLNNSELNEQVFVDNPFGGGLLYRSGDLGRYDRDGNILFSGRCDHQVKINGLRIELGEIEAALQQIKGISESLVLARDKQLVAYLLGNTQQLSNQALKQQLATALPAYMVPAHFVTVQSWPLNANGKIDRSALPEPETATQLEYVAPRDETEAAICAIVGNVLGIARVGVHDNFFDIGGHSLAASRAIVQIREHFAMDIPLNVLFDMTTVEKLATWINAAQWARQSQQTGGQASEEGRDTGFI